MDYSRRDFLQAMVGASSFLSLAPSFPALLPRAAAALETDGSGDDRVLIVLQLSGGNDGLNTVVPYADDAYARNRDTLRLSASQVIKLDEYLGFHRELQDFHRLLDEGLLTVVQGVGYPHNNRDHDAAMREWHTARPGELQYPTGWIGRTADVMTAQGQTDIPAVFVGPIASPFALNAQATVVPAVRTLAQLTRTATWDLPAQPSQPFTTAALAPGTAANPLLDVVSAADRGADDVAQRVETVLAAGSESATDYPSFTLAQQLRMVAQLIRAEVGIRIYFVELGGGGIGGFDNHANQRDNHAALLREMSASIAALLGELQRENLASRVLLMTFSEFGRTVSENGRRGTDHGAAAPVFLAGGCVKGGVCGEHPSLADLDQDALKFRIDYRGVYATVLHRWLGLDPVPVLGESYDTLDVIA